MKQKFLLMILVLGLLSINTSAQTKKRTSNKKSVTTTASSVSKHREKSWGDGFIWYKLKKGNLYGAQDIEGNMIIPTQYSKIEYGEYLSSSDIQTFPQIDTPQYFRVFSGDFIGIYSREGKCIIPVERHYTEAFMCCEDDSNTTYCYFRVAKNGGKVGLCDLQGREVIPPVYDNGSITKVIGIYTERDFNRKKHNDRPYIMAKKGNMGYLFDLDGNLKWSEPCGSDYPIVFSDGIFANNESYPHIMFSRNTKYDYTIYSHLGTKSHRYSSSSSYTSSSSSSSSSSNSSSSSTSSSSSSSSSSNNSGGGTTKIVVEHQHTPQPVQQWQACFGCGGMGTMGCDNCGGSGTKYIGNSLRTCSRCNGRGIIPCNVCYGNKGQYVTVYR